MQKQRLTAFLLVLFLLLPLSIGCTEKTSSQNFYAMDTVVTVTLYQTDRAVAKEVFASCDTLLTELDRLWSRTNETSEVSRLCTDGILQNPDSRTVKLLLTAQTVQDLSNGAYSVAVAPLIDLWESAAKANRLPTEAELAQACNRVNSATLTVTDSEICFSGAMDLGSIGKGAAASLLIELIQSFDVPGGFVSFGSNVARFGEKPDGKPFRVAIKDPLDTNSTVGVLTLTEGEILSVSGDYERFYTIEGKKYHHLLNLSTGMPAESGLHSVAVIAEDGALADALSTALFVMGEETSMELYSSGACRFEAVFCRENGEITTTAGLSSRFTVNEK